MTLSSGKVRSCEPPLASVVSSFPAGVDTNTEHSTEQTSYVSPCVCVRACVTVCVARACVCKAGEPD